MRIKSYFANSVTEAINRARTELGPEAMIIASNRASEDAERPGAYEVVFGVANAGTGAEAESTAEAHTTPEGLERLRERMEELRKSVSKKREQAAASRFAPFGPKVAASLLKAGFPEAVAEDMGRALQVRSRGDKQAAPADPLAAALSERLRFSPRFGSGNQGRSIVALVGSPGVGKTSTLVKLGVTYGLASGRPIRFISTDVNRLGGTDLLCRYARWMGVTVDLPRSLEALEQCLEGGQRNELVLLDTPGYSRANFQSALPLAGLLSKRAGIDVHLVLPAFASPADLASTVTRFKPFLPSKVIFTSVDLCESIAPALALAIAEEMPLSFLGTGDQVPEDLEEAGSAKLAARLLPVLMEAAASAA